MRYKTRRQFREENLMLWARNRELIQDRYLAEHKLDMMEEAFDEERESYLEDLRICLEDCDSYRDQRDALQKKVKDLRVTIDALAEGYALLYKAVMKLGGAPDRVPSKTTPADR